MTLLRILMMCVFLASGYAVALGGEPCAMGLHAETAAKTGSATQKTAGATDTMDCHDTASAQETGSDNPPCCDDGCTCGTCATAHPALAAVTVTAETLEPDLIDRRADNRLHTLAHDLTLPPPRL
ncbi:hypothetical protein [Eilatimonas milleporae]|uniref:CopL family metal-binding regulatory protein n=1 Tax=Eilatimonas milleporae TaxID=911205 RepID=A0A3M0CM61_9PROT|nr:hypothetical protein [Eilatimonas milleporae]RMB08149.1 hypothetical protein BXY39_2245 [Eilatimonas milleporae]